MFEIKLNSDVKGCHEFGVAELPYMDMMTTNHARKSRNIFLDLVHVDACWNGL
jgi:hypothetical protein